MSTSFDERISAFIDDELTDFELRRVTDEVLSDESLKQRFHRYSLIGDAMRNDLPESLDMDLSSRVMAAIETEGEAQVVPLVTNQTRWKKPLAGAAIAASVAAAALVSLQTLTSGQPGLTPAAVAPVASVSDPASVVPQSPTQVVPKLANSSTLPAMPAAQGMVTTVSAEQPVPAGITKPVVQLSPSSVNGYLTTHSEFVSRPGVMSRIRVLGFENAQQ